MTVQTQSSALLPEPGRWTLNCLSSAGTVDATGIAINAIEVGGVASSPG